MSIFPIRGRIQSAGSVLNEAVEEGFIEIASRGGGLLKQDG